MKIPVPFVDLPRVCITSIEEAKQILPEGWYALLDEAWRFRLYLGLTTIWARIEKGLLRFDFKEEGTWDGIDGKLCGRISQSIARSSATVCMVCGKYGIRRKNEQSWPCLCSSHYIEFANQLVSLEESSG